MSLNPYASQLGEREPLAVIAATPARLRELSARIGASRITIPRAAGKWSPRDILCHLADCEIVFAFRLRQTLADDNPVIQPFNQDRWAAPYGTQSADDALAAFCALRAWNVSLVKGLAPAARARRVTHPERGEMSFQTVLETMGGHDLNHIGQLEALVTSAA
ncbi:MAG TPA: DinB family protein [Vicinamibacterales bacterium]|jgi:hypothetical protein